MHRREFAAVSADPAFVSPLPDPARARFDPGSFRDRTSRVVLSGDRVLRALSARGWEAWQAVSTLPFLDREMAAGRIVATQALPNAPEALWAEATEFAPGAGCSAGSEADVGAQRALPVADRSIGSAAAIGPRAIVAEAVAWTGWLEHARIPIVSYPYEWSFGMLRDAALLTLDLMLAALADGAILKDATPYNVQFVDARPVFIDLPSFVPHDGGPWEGYQQFCQMFLFPLLLQAHRGIDFQPWLRGRLEGIAPAECWKLLGWTRLLRRGVWSHVWMHSLLAGPAGRPPVDVKGAMQESGFQRELITANVTKLRRIVAGLAWRPRSSRWSDYDLSSAPVASDAGAKMAFAERTLGSKRWKLAIDLGCNTGRYSRLAAAHADQVLALDVDHLSIDRLHQALQSERQPRVLPLVYNLADPSPNLGWRGRERRDLPSRARPDVILCLALLHHLVLHENLPLPEVLDELARPGAALLIEFVDKSDPQARGLLANRVDQYSDYSAEAFEAELSRRFEIRERLQLPSQTRTLFWATPRSDSSPR